MNLQQQEAFALLSEPPIQFPVNNPYSFYNSLRKESPIYRASPLQWVFTDYDDAVALLQNPLCSHWGQDPDTQMMMFGGQGAFAKTLFAFAPDSNLPYRKKIMHGLAAKSLRFEVESMQKQADDLLRGMRHKKEIDFMLDYAHPYTFSTISRIVGVPEKEINNLVNIVASLKHGYFGFIVSPEATGTGADFLNFMRSLIEYKKLHPGEDLCSALIETCHSEKEDDSFILSMLLLLFYAGHDNMMSFMGNAICALHEHPTTQEALRQSPERVDGCIDELLRYDSPVQFFLLFAKDDISLKGKNIRAGSQLLVCVGAANRDPKVFKNPDQIDLDRKPSHLSYGTGAYRCIGARLAQLQAATGLRKFIEATVSYSIDKIRWRHTPYIQRGPVALNLQINFK